MAILSLYKVQLYGIDRRPNIEFMDRHFIAVMWNLCLSPVHETVSLNNKMKATDSCSIKGRKSLEAEAPRVAVM